MGRISDDAREIVRAIEANTRELKKLTQVIEKNTRQTRNFQAPPPNEHSITE